MYSTRSRMFVGFGVWMYCATALLSQGVSRPPPLKTSTADVPKGALAKTLSAHSPDCGANALYVFLRLHNVPCTLDSVRKDVPLTGLGANMLDLKKGAQRFGLACSVIETSSSMLNEYLPVIARMELAGRHDHGHFVVVTKGNKAVLNVIDGTTGTFTTTIQDGFNQNFSGYALVAASTQAPIRFRRADIILAITASVQFLAFGLLTWRRFGAVVVGSANVALSHSPQYGWKA